MRFRRPLAVLVTLLGIVPVLAAGRPACCVAKPAPVLRPCCAAMAASAPKGCCKVPAAPKPEARSQSTGAPAALTAAAVGVVAPAIVTCAPTVVESARLAQRGHRAPSPTDSPPDRLSLHQAFLI